MPITLTRRKLLQLAIAVPLAVSEWRAAQASARPSDRHKPERVVVVGAGLSGLAAALELVDAGHDVTVLEVQSRPGGRVLTLRQPFADGLHADMGAARIPLVHDWTLKYVARFGLSLTPFWPSAYDEVCLFGAKRVVRASDRSLDLTSLPLALTDAERRMGMDALLAAVYSPLTQLAGDPRHTDWPPRALRRFDRMTMLQYVQSQGWSRDVAALTQFGYGEADADYGILEDVRELAHDPTFAARMKIAGGNDQLPRAMAARLGHRVHYGCAVTRIEQDAHGVRVFSRTLAGEVIHVANRAIVAIPMPPLRRIAFSPALSSGKQRAIRELRYDPLSRVALQVRGRPWMSGGRRLFGKTDLPSEIWDASWDQSGERGVVSVFIKNRASLRLDQMSEDERVAFAIRHAEAVMPGLSAVVEAGVAKNWTLDPWAGGLAWLAPRQFTELMPHVARVEGRLHFAGEHTSAWHGWMQGALESGSRAAREVLDAAKVAGI